jgi:uncharacterized protein (TIGR00251 family)
MSDVSIASGADGGVRLAVRVMPRSPRNVIDGVRAGRLVIRVTAPPVDAAANEAAVGVLAAALGLPRQAVRIVSGAASRNKTIEILGATQEQVRALLPGNMPQ